uniref:NADH dehydrogenase subunit 6 n=1 Tax=Tridacna squamosa TaxID=80830 RepID=A0A0U1YXU0_TRISQ|nr:NADH dehydrogenase subunit 6 [Tridacna squamosa]AJK90893.1 NADH dehydrogenase subunit 6 [Tridacna squamosa]
MMSSIISLAMFFMCLGAVAAVHPISLGCYIFLLVSLCAVLMSIEYSAFLGFCLYMVIVGGLLVVFAYAAALSPAANFKLNFMNVCPGAVVVFAISSFISWIYSDDGLTANKEYQQNLGLGFDWSWGVLIVFLGILLFMVMVTVVNICLVTGEGALVASSTLTQKSIAMKKMTTNPDWKSRV